MAHENQAPVEGPGKGLLQVQKGIRCHMGLPGPPKESKIMAQYPKIESIGSTGSVILAILEVQVSSMLTDGTSAGTIKKVLVSTLGGP